MSGNSVEVRDLVHVAKTLLSCHRRRLSSSSSSSSSRRRTRKRREVKAVLVGPGHSGKTALAAAFVRPGAPFDPAYDPTVLETHSFTVEDSRNVTAVKLWDTAGVADYGRLRPLTYSGADVVVLCFAVDRADEFAQLDGKWRRELEDYAADIPLLLVGTKTDLRTAEKSEDLVSAEAGAAMAARLGADAYMECSVATTGGTGAAAAVFRAAARVANEAAEAADARRVSLPSWL